MSIEGFNAQIGRLKQVLGLHEDQEVAAALGMSKAALSARKARGVFPEKDLRALISRRPELGIDVLYVLTGEREYREPETQDQFADRMQAIKATSLIVDALGLSERDRDGLKDSLTGDPAKDGALIAQTLARQQTPTPQRVIASYGPPPVISHGFHEPEPGTPLVGPDEALLVARYRASPKVLREAVLRMLAPDVDLPAVPALDNVIGK